MAKKPSSLSWNDRLALIKAYTPSDSVICNSLGVSQDELNTARDLESAGTFVATADLDVDSYGELFGDDSIVAPAKTAPESIVKPGDRRVVVPLCRLYQPDLNSDSILGLFTDYKSPPECRNRSEYKPAPGKFDVESAIEYRRLRSTHDLGAMSFQNERTAHHLLADHLELLTFNEDVSTFLPHPKVDLGNGGVLLKDIEPKREDVPTLDIEDHFLPGLVDS